MAKKKVLVIWNEIKSDFGLPKFYSDSLKEMGFEVDELGLHADYISLIRWYNYRVVKKILKIDFLSFFDNFLTNHEIKKILSQSNFDFVLFFRCERISPKFLEELRLMVDVPFINIYSENPFVVQRNAEIHLSTISKYDLIITFSKLYVPVFYQLGARNVKVLKFAASKNQLLKYNSKKKHKVTYFGTWGPIQEYWLQDLDIEVYGSKWNSKNSKIKYLSGGMKYSMSNIINRSEMVLNFVRSEHMCLSSMKTFEIPAASALMLCNFSEDQNDIFQDLKHCIYFHSYYEIKDKIEFIQKRPTLIQSIANNAFNEVRLNHTYLNRCKELLNFIKEI